MTHTIHLIDDNGMGGVSRFLAELMEGRPGDRVETVKRRGLNARSYDAATVVSHLAIGWKSLPKMIALRACNPSAHLIHVEHSYSRGFAQHCVPKMERFRTLLTAAYALFDRIVCVSQAQAQWLVDEGIVPPAKIAIATPTTDLAAFERIGAADPAPHVRFGFVGRLAPQKGLDIALRAWRTLQPRNATIEIFGDGPMREDLERQFGDVPSIRFHGATDTPEEAYRQIDVAIMPSRWEPYGLSCLEARAAGRPVIASDVDGLREQLKGAQGHLVPADHRGWLSVFAADPRSYLLEDAGDQNLWSARADRGTSQIAWNGVLASRTAAQADGSTRAEDQTVSAA